MGSRDHVREYADAFYEAAWERWLSILGAFADQVEARPDLRARLEGGAQDVGQIQRLVDGALPADADRPVRNLLYTLVQRNEIGLLPGLIGSLRERLRHKEAGPTEVEVVSAVPLIEAEKQSLLARLGDEYGADLNVHYQVNPAILGGLIIRVGDRLLDNSVASKLAAMKQALGLATG